MQTDNLTKPNRFLHRTLFALAAILGIELGAGGFTTVVVFPVWASSPEAAIGFKPGAPYYLEEGDFFMFSSCLSLLVSIVALIAGRRAAPPLRLWIRIASISFIFIFVWSVIYFIPIQDTTFKGDAGTIVPREELASMLQTFVQLNYLRQAILIAAFLSALHGLGLSYRMNKTKENI